jgi:hypothetical protein
VSRCLRSAADLWDALYVRQLAGGFVPERVASSTGSSRSARSQRTGNPRLGSCGGQCGTVSRVSRVRRFVRPTTKKHPGRMLTTLILTPYAAPHGNLTYAIPRAGVDG